MKRNGDVFLKEAEGGTPGDEGDVACSGARPEPRGCMGTAYLKPRACLPVPETGASSWVMAMLGAH